MLDNLQGEAQISSFKVNQGRAPEPQLSLANELPTEVLQQVFYSLHPADFNAARHTCRAWLISSLERSLLEDMLRRGGWSSSIPRTVGLSHPSKQANVNEKDTMNEVWQMSKRLSRECALGPDWTGNGLDETRSVLD